MPSKARWIPLTPDKWGARFERFCPTCAGRTFQVIQEKERAKKHKGKRADRVVVVCANPECREHDENKCRRVGWVGRRSL
jgi:hypothetical protein